MLQLGHAGPHLVQLLLGAKQHSDRHTRNRGNPKRPNSVDIVFLLLSLPKEVCYKHFVTLVQIHHQEGWGTLSALIDPGATMNFIFQLRAKELDPKPGSNRPPAVMSIDGHWLRTYAIVSTTIYLRDSSNTFFKTIELTI